MGLVDDIFTIYRQIPNLKSLKIEGIEIELYQPSTPVQVASMPYVPDMPPDDVMMFAATEDVDDLMRQRQPE